MTEPDPETGTNVGAARLRERVIQIGMRCVDAGPYVEVRAELAAALDAYAAYERQRGRVEGRRYLMERVAGSYYRPEEVWGIMKPEILSDMAEDVDEAAQALRALEDVT